jgi:hypothetical protein
MIPDWDGTLAWSLVVVGAVAYGAWRIDCYCEENGYELPGHEEVPNVYDPKPQAVVEQNRKKTGESEDGEP